jgi:hypothetical protein
MEFLKAFQNNYGNKYLSNIRLLNIEKEKLKFVFIKEKKVETIIELNLGFEAISEKFFRHNIPTANEVEFAINLIEDELMSNKKLINHNETLICMDENSVKTFAQNKKGQNIFTRQYIEDIFSQYAYYSMGGPLSEEARDITREYFANVLIVREIMHHLDFREIEIIK